MYKKARVSNILLLITLITCSMFFLCASSVKGETFPTQEKLQANYLETIGVNAGSGNNSGETVFFVFLCVGCIIFYLICNNYVSIKRNEELRKANEAKAEFLSRMSHEIRTPLSAIIGLNNITAEKINDRACVEEYVEKVGVSAKYLLELLNDVLDMAEINEGKMTLNQQPFEMNELIRVIEAVYRPIAKESGRELFVHVDDEAKVSILGDELRMKQVIINLISNGVKYNRPEGKVWFNVEKLEDLEGNFARFRFSVEDNGIGISDENSAKIFGAFERERSSDINMINGTGLGLTISSEIVKLMGSRLNVESTVGKGSRFWFDVTLKICREVVPEKKKVEEKVYDFSNKHFLIVEDNETNAMIEQYILVYQKGTVDWAKDGKIGCEMFEKSPVGYYDAILMDIRMPVMDGCEATECIRKMDREDAKTIQIVAVSANTYQEDVRKCLESGMNAHCAKPVNRKQLLEQLNS